MSDAPDAEIKVERAGKPALFSRTIQFNIGSGVLIPAIWPFLPKHFRDQDYAIAAVTAWYTIANVVLRMVTKEAVNLLGKKKNDS